MKEIVTLQIGSYANFVGSHFWNFQDELLGLETRPAEDPVFLSSGINFDVLYRVGETRQGVSTYTPRLLAIDSRGSFGAVKAAGSLYEQLPSAEISSVTTWRGRISKHVAEPILKNEFLQSLENDESDWKIQEGIQQSRLGSEVAQKDLVQSLENDVQFWTDYSKVHFHPLSLYELEGLWHGITPFDDIGSGKGLLTGSINEEAQDRLRFFVEETDSLQGLQVLVDDSNGFAGVSIDFLEAVRDEYDKTPVLLFNARPPSSFKKPTNSYTSIVRALHDAISFSELSCLSQCMIPVGVPSFGRSDMFKYLRINDTKDFHTSAVYAAAISCATLPLRMVFSGPSASTYQSHVGSIDMESLVHMLLGESGRRVSILDSAMPAPAIPGANKRESLDVSVLQPLTSDVSDSLDTGASEALVFQGALTADPVGRASVPVVMDCLYRHRQELKPSYCHLAASLCPLAIPLPFPNLFQPCIGQNGELLIKPTDRSSRRTGSDVSSIPMAARLRTSTAVLPYLERRLHNLQHFGLSRGSLGGQVLEGWNLQKDEVQELCELSSKTVAAYGGGVLGSSSDSD